MKLASHSIVESHSSEISRVLCLSGMTKFGKVLRAVCKLTLDDLARV
jgi:hypothetical protein